MILKEKPSVCAGPLRTRDRSCHGSGPARYRGGGSRCGSVTRKEMTGLRFNQLGLSAPSPHTIELASNDDGEN